MRRKCKICGKLKSINEFANAGIINGIKYFRWKCIPCYSKSKLPRKQLIKNWYYDLKKQYSCENCSQNDFRVLDFDHKDRREKKFNVSEGISKGYSRDLIVAEIAKCRVLCANCHRIKTFEEYETISGISSA